MAKILCAISGIQFSCDHVPMTMISREVSHPIFHLKKTKLMGLYAKWTQGSLTEIDSYLLYLAGLNSTELVTWNTPAIRTGLTSSIVANNMIQLFECLGRMVDTPRYSETYAAISVNSENKDLSTSHVWIAVWNKNRKDYDDGYRHIKLMEVQHRREDILARLIKDSSKSPESYAKILSNWAKDAGKFPEFQVKHPLSNRNMRCSEYWMDIISRCVRDDSIFMIPQADLDELIEHCEENISGGSIYAHSLFELLKLGKRKKNNYLGLGDSDLSVTRYRIVTTKATAEDINKMALIDSAPENEPKRMNYPSELAFLRAKLKYQMKLDYLKELEEDSPKISSLAPAVASSLEPNSDSMNTPIGDI